ncbi:MAG TPA: hypothetical protein P5315_12665, partial [Clostridia bacterium]|nr:hypothetical protein [Clostridia bacterium]
GNIREFISQNPTFRDNFSGLCVKAEYFIEKSRKFCEAESRYKIPATINHCGFLHCNKPLYRYHTIG